MAVSQWLNGAVQNVMSLPLTLICSAPVPLQRNESGVASTNTRVDAHSHYGVQPDKLHLHIQRTEPSAYFQRQVYLIKLSITAKFN